MVSVEHFFMQPIQQAHLFQRCNRFGAGRQSSRNTAGTRRTGVLGSVFSQVLSAGSS